jgi:hypothetical protein
VPREFRGDPDELSASATDSVSISAEDRISITYSQFPPLLLLVLVIDVLPPSAPAVVVVVVAGDIAWQAIPGLSFSDPLSFARSSIQSGVFAHRNSPACTSNIINRCRHRLVKK